MATRDELLDAVAARYRSATRAEEAFLDGVHEGLAQADAGQLIGTSDLKADLRAAIEGDVDPETMSVRWTPQARKSLHAILLYMAQDDPAAAHALVDRLIDSVEGT